MKKILFTIFLALILISCGEKSRDSSGVSKNSEPIKIGSKDFTEGLIVSEIYAFALENEGYRVERVENIAGSVIHTAITSGQIDMYPEYTGTALLSILKLPLETDSQKVYDTVKEAYAKQFNITWLDYTKANDSQGLVMRTDKANEYGIKTISDLQKHADKLRFALQGEFDLRDDGIPGLTKIYGDFKWKSSKIYDNSLKYEILKNNEADVTPAYTTEGRLVDKENYTLLEDDKKFWPPYNLTPIVKNEVLEKYPEISGILNKISSRIDTQTITDLNAKVDVDGREYKEVAREFFDSIK